MLSFHNLVLITTNICNLHCRHCYPESGASSKEAFRFSNKKTMSVDQVERYVSQLPKLLNVRKKVHIGGGESTIFRKEFLLMIDVISKYGLASSLVTNSSWATSQKEADRLMHECKSKGLVESQLSVSSFHQEFLDIEYVVRAIRACKKFNILPVVRPIITKTSSIADTLRNIPMKDLEGVFVASSLCQPIGRARSGVVNKDLYYSKLDHIGCFNELNLTIRQDGRVFPCCAGGDILDSLCLGNADKEPLKKIITRAELDPLISILLVYGPKYIAEILVEQGENFRLKKKYVSICHLCYDLFNDDLLIKRARQALARHFDKVKYNKRLESLVV